MRKIYGGFVIWTVFLSLILGMVLVVPFVQYMGTLERTAAVSCLPIAVLLTFWVWLAIGYRHGLKVFGVFNRKDSQREQRLAEEAAGRGALGMWDDASLD